MIGDGWPIPSKLVAGRLAICGTHMLDILIWLMGDVDKVDRRVAGGTKRYGDCDELGESIIQFKSGALGTLAASWDDIADPISLVISGTEGYAYVLNGKLFFQSKHVEGADGKHPWTKLPQEKSAGFAAFLDAIEGKPHSDLVTATEAAYRSKVMGAMYEAASINHWVTIS